MYEDYKAYGLEILMFPSNTFNQEPLTNEETKPWLEKNFGGNFLVMGKCEVNGKGTSEVYRWLKSNSELYNKSTGKTKDISWNYAKFLVDGEGKVVKYLSP